MVEDTAGGVVTKVVAVDNKSEEKGNKKVHFIYTKEV
jgi:hypothetical protein